MSFSCLEFLPRHIFEIIQYEQSVFNWFNSHLRSYNPYKRPYKCIIGVSNLLIGVITLFITTRGLSCRLISNKSFWKKCWKIDFSQEDPQKWAFFLNSHSEIMWWNQQFFAELPVASKGTGAFCIGKNPGPKFSCARSFEVNINAWNYLGHPRYANF